MGIPIHLVSAVRVANLAMAAVVVLFATSWTATITFWSIAFLLIVAAFSSREYYEKQPLTLIVSGSLTIYFSLRLAQFAIDDTYAVRSFFPLARVLGDADSSYAFLILATCGLYLGLLQPRAGPRQDNLVRNASGPSPYALGFAYLAVASAVGAITLLSGGGEHVRQANYIVRTVVKLLNPDVWMFACVYYTTLLLPARRRRQMLLALLIAYILGRSLMGSRSGIVDFAVIWLSVTAAVKPHFAQVRLGWRNVVFAAAIALMSIAIYVVVQEMRVLQYGASLGDSMLTTAMSAEHDLPTFVTQSILYRLGINLDTLLFVGSEYINTYDADSRVNVATALTSTLERSLHVDLDPTVRPAEYELAWLIGTEPYWVGNEEQNVAYSWGIFAYYQQLFGMAGGAIASYVTGFALAKLFGLGSVVTRSPARLILAILISYVTAQLIVTFGIDNLLDRLQGMAFGYVAYFLLSQLLPVYHSGGNIVTSPAK